MRALTFVVRSGVAEQVSQSGHFLIIRWRPAVLALKEKDGSLDGFRALRHWAAPKLCFGKSG
ncbi:MAG: hypothetical protein AAFR02_10805, partial [Pseudomonadota bacterium]